MTFFHRHRNFLAGTPLLFATLLFGCDSVQTEGSPPGAVTLESGIPVQSALPEEEPTPTPNPSSFSYDLSTEFYQISADFDVAYAPCGGCGNDLLFVVNATTDVHADVVNEDVPNYQTVLEQDGAFHPFVGVNFFVNNELVCPFYTPVSRHGLHEVIEVNIEDNLDCAGAIYWEDGDIVRANIHHGLGYFSNVPGEEGTFYYVDYRIRNIYWEAFEPTDNSNVVALRSVQ